MATTKSQPKINITAIYQGMDQPNSLMFQSLIQGMSSLHSLVEDHHSHVTLYEIHHSHRSLSMLRTHPIHSNLHHLQILGFKDVLHSTQNLPYLVSSYFL